MSGSLSGTALARSNSGALAHSGTFSTVPESDTVVYGKRSHLDLSNASSLFISDPSCLPPFVPDDLEFDNSSVSDPSLSADSGASPPRQSINTKARTAIYSPLASPPPTADGDSADATDFQDSSFINNSRAQFDLDISIDENKVVDGNIRLSPWRKFTANQGPVRNSSVLGKRIFTLASQGEPLQSKKLDEVTKQLTNCKIQLKLYERFLQDLIDRHQIDAGELSGLGTNLQARSVSTLEQEHADMCSLVEDLYASVEEFQGKWRDADKRMLDLDHTLHELAFEVADMLGQLGSRVDADPGATPRAFLEAALPRLREVIESLSENTHEDHINTILRLQREHEATKSDNANSEKMLRAQLHEIAQWKSKYNELRREYEMLENKAESSEFEKLQTENSRLSSLNKVVDDKLHNYQMMISQLQKEVNEFRDLSRKGSLSDVSDSSTYTGLRDREKYLLLQRDFDNLQRLHDNMAGEFERFKETSASTISSLTNQLNNRKRELLSLRAEHTSLDNIQHDLEVSLEKQRVLNSEKMKLAWQVESLTKDKAALQASVDQMTEKLGKGEDSRRLQDTKQQLEALVRLDVWEFQRLFESFNKIADDSSLESPKEKIGVLASAIAENGQDVEFGSLKDYHKSVFDYFARAVETIVNDHIRLLLKESEGSDNEDQVKKLEKKVASLERQLQAHGPGSKLRIEELTNRWKVEREARVHDNEQAKKRLQQLEDENEQLRQGKA